MQENEINQFDRQYLPGFKNRMIRYYFYLEQGLAILNIFRNLFLGIFGLYLTLKLTHYGYMILMFGISIPILIVVGYYSVHRIAKIKEWLGIRFSTHYSVQQFNYSKDTAETLKDIKKIIEEKK